MGEKQKEIDMPVFAKLTEKQAICLQFIYRFYEGHSYYPTRREIADEMGVSPQSANRYIEYLIKKGYLLRVDGEVRNIRLNPDALAPLRRLGIIQPIQREEESN